MTKHTEDSDDVEDDSYRLILFVAGASANSVRAIANLNAICEQHLAGKYALEVIDVHQDYSLAEREQIVALPMMVKATPLPPRRLIGDMSDTRKVLAALNIHPTDGNR